MLGVPQVLLDGQPVEALGTSKNRALLFYIAARARRCTRQELMGLLWGDSAEKSARQSLRVALSGLRRVLPNCIEADNESVWLIDSAETDTHHLSQQQNGDPAQLAATITTYRGDFLETFELRKTPQFAEWLIAERERWRLIAAQLMQQLSIQYEQASDLTAAIAITQRWLSLDNWREETHRRLMRLYALDGQRGAALAQFEQCRQLLNDELGLDPSAETMVLMEEIRSDSLSAAPFSTDTASHNLPTPPTALIGRTALLPQLILRLNDDDCQLLTLVGAGGMGKTRLSIAAGLAVSKSRRVRWVDMSGVASGDMETPLVTAIVEALDIDLLPQPEPLQQVITYLKRQPTVLIVDNLEQLTDRVHILSDLLKAVADLKILATSRERLNLSQEWLLEVDGLPLDEAVDLFNAAALRVQPDFDPDAAAASAHLVCELVGGMPLALELAASWLRLLGVSEIVAELRQNIDIISTRSRDLPERHRSLRAVFDYSWAQLSAEERIVLPKLAVFRGGFDRHAALAIADANLDLLASLIDKSLLRRREKGRYGLHVAVRQYAASRADDDETATTARQHARYFLDWISQVEPSEISAELDNLHTAWRWVISHDSALARCYIDPLANFYEAENRTTETIDLFDAALASPLANIVDKVALASWRRQLGEAHFRLGRMTTCRDLQLQALSDLDMPIPSNRVALGLAMSRQMAQQVAHRRRMPGPSQDGADARLEATRLFERLGQIFFFENDSLTAGYTALKGLNLAETIPVSAELARLYANTCLAVGIMPQAKLASIYQDAALKAIADVDDPATTAWVLEVLSIYNSGIANWAQVNDWIDQALVQADLVGDQRRRDECLVMHATTANYTGNIRRSFEVWHEMYTAARARADNQVIHWSIGGMLEMLTKLGELEQHLDLVDEVAALDAVHDENDNVSALTLHSFWAQKHLLENDLMSARDSVVIGAKLAERITPTSYSSLEGYASLAEVTLMLRQLDPIQFGSLKKEARTILTAYRKFARVFPIGQPNLAFCQGWQLWLGGNQSAALARWERGLAGARRMGMRLDEAKLLGAFGRTTPDRYPQALAQAQQLFEETEAKGEQKRWLETLPLA